MMNELSIHEHPAFGQVRMIMESGKRLTCALDAAKALGYSNPHDALRLHCRYLAKYEVPHPQNPDKTIAMNFIPDGDLYRLIAHSRLPSAEQFESWIFDDIVPSVVDTGTYTAPGALSTRDAIQLKEIEARYNNSLVRKAAELRKLADNSAYPVEYKQILYAKATEILAGQALLPLPEAPRQTYTAAEVAEQYHLSAQRIGRLANQHRLKTDRYGMYVWTKSQYSAKEVRSFVYYDTVFEALDRIVGKPEETL